MASVASFKSHRMQRDIHLVDYGPHYSQKGRINHGMLTG